MKSIFKAMGLALAGFACVLLVAGCEMFGTGGKSVNFAAASNLTTKAVYGDDFEDGGVSYQQIVWENGDQIRIASNHAWTVEQDYYANYNVRHTRDNGRNSYGKLSTQGDGLQWTEEWTHGYDFWAMYPASAATSLEEFNFSGNFTANIPRDQYLMVAHTAAAYAQNKIVLEFYPAFTAFRITVRSDVEGVTINNCSLKSSDPNIPLTGDFSAHIEDQGISNYAPVSNLGYTASSSIVRSEADGSRTFVIFCLPGDLSNLVLTCSYTQDGASKTKSLLLADGNGAPMTFSACKQHRMDLTVKTSSSGGGIEFDLSIGGAQMILSILKEQIQGSGWQLAYEKYQANQPEGFRDFNDFWDKFTNQHVNNYFNTFVSGADKTNPPDCRAVFTEAYFSETELEIIRDFLPTVTSYRHQNTLSESIYASDFDYLPNLRTIYQSEVDQGTVNVQPNVSIEIDGMESLENVNLHKWPNVTVRNCPNLQTLTYQNTDNNIGADILVENCPQLTSFNGDWNAQNARFVFRDLPAFQSINLPNAQSVTVQNCGSFTTLNMQQAKNLNTLVLSNTPNFQSGNLQQVEGTVAVTLSNCSTNVSGATINMQGNGNATNAGKTNSDNVTLTFKDYAGNVKASF